MKSSHPSWVEKNARRGKDVVEISLKTIIASDCRIPSIGRAGYELRHKQEGELTTRVKSRLASCSHK